MLKVNLNKWDKFVIILRKYALEIAIVISIVAAIVAVAGIGYRGMVTP